MQVSDASVRRQLDRLGGRFGVIPVVVDGEVFAGEAVPVTLPLTPQISVVVRVDIPVCRLDTRYSTLRGLLGRRKMKHERDAKARRESFKESQAAEGKARVRDMLDEFGREWEAADRGKLHFGMSR